MMDGTGYGTGDGGTDSLDALLIRALQTDGRASIHDLAETFGVSRDLVSHRLKRLTEQDGLRIVAALDPGFAGHHLLTHALVDIDGPVTPVARALADLPDAVFVSMTSGLVPLVFEARHADIAELHALLAHVRKNSAVRRIRVTTYAEVLKGFFVSEHRSDIALDAIDFDLIAILQEDGRASYRAMSEAVHLSPSAVRSRVQRLVGSGVIRISAIKSGGVSQNRLAIGIGVIAQGDVQPISEFIHGSSSIDFAARTHGSYDFVATLVGSSAGRLLEAMEELRAIPSVSSLETWAHLNIVKEDYARTLGRVMRPQGALSQQS